MLSSEGSSVQDLARRFTQLNAKWTEVTNIIFEKNRVVQDASHQYGEFKGTAIYISFFLNLGFYPFFLGFSCLSTFLISFIHSFFSPSGPRNGLAGQT